MDSEVVVLAVDDDERNLRMVQGALSPLGCSVRIARGGDEALASVRTAAPDVILLDVMMPGMDGYQVCRLLKSDEETRLIPVLLVSGLNSHEDRVRAIEAGCDDFISKPFDIVELRARVRTLARLSYAGLRRREEEILARAVEDLGDGLVIAGEEGEVLLANRRARELLGVHVNPAGVPFTTLMDGRYEFEPRLTWDDLRDTESHTFSAAGRDLEGTRGRWLQIAMSRVQPRQASIATRYVITLRDITREITEQPRMPEAFDVLHRPARCESDLRLPRAG